MLKIRHIILSFFLVYLLTIPNLQAQSRTVQGVAIIGAGKVVKNSQAFKDTLDVTKLALGTETTDENLSDNQSNAIKLNQAKSNDNSNFITSTFQDAKDILIKDNKQVINDIGKSSEGFKSLGESIGGMFGKDNSKAKEQKNNIYF